MKQKRILHVVRKMDNGGVQSMLMNYYRTINRNKIQFDFIVNENSAGFYDNEIRKLGGQVYYTSHQTASISYLKFLYNLLSCNNYDAIHIHQNFANVYPLAISFLCNVPLRISHSHNAYPEKSKFRAILKRVASILINYLSNCRVACSINAGQWLYGNRKIPELDFKLVFNAVDLRRFRKNSVVRDRIRTELGCSEKIVIGHIGNFGTQKNQKFVVDIFQEILKINNHCHLIFVGSGEMEEEVKWRVSLLGLEKSVTFLGNRNDIDEVMQCFDVFLLPSIFEGLPVVLIEAQAIGIPCLASTSVSTEANITDLVKFKSLGDSASDWAHAVIERTSRMQKEVDVVPLAKTSYDLVHATRLLEGIYQADF